MKFSIRDLFSKCDQMRKTLRIWSHLLKKYLMEKFIFCAVIDQNFEAFPSDCLNNSLKQEGAFLLNLFFFSYFISKYFGSTNRRDRLWSPCWLKKIAVMSHYNSFGYTSNRCTFNTQYFYYCNSFLKMFSCNNTILFNFCFLHFLNNLSKCPTVMCPAGFPSQ